MAENWSIKGGFFETCNCEVACPCAFLSPPTEGECKAACERMAELECPEAEPDEDGNTCVEVCINAEASGIIRLNPSCRAQQDSCEAMEDKC